MVHLTKLRAQSVRGLPRSWPDLSIAERGIVLCGDNGVGKSSFVDALEYALTGQSTLYPNNRLGVSWEKGSPHVRDGDPSVWVEIHTKGGVVKVTPNMLLQNLPEEARIWAARARQSTFVLRRHMLVDFINCEPSKRYSALEPFLNLSTYDIVENALKHWLDDLNTSYASLEAERNGLQTSLLNTFGVASGTTVTEERLLSALNPQLRKVALTECNRLADAPVIRAAVETQLGGEGISQRVAQLGALKNALDQAGLPNSLLSLIRSLREAVQSLERERTQLGRQILEDWLTRGKQIIESSPAGECPLCEQPVDRTKLLARLAERIDQECTVATANALVGERKRALLIPARPMLARMHTLHQTWNRVFADFPAEYTDAVTLLRDIVSSAEDDSIDSTALIAVENRTAASLASHSAALGKVEAEIRAEGGGERRAGLLSARDMLARLTADLPAYRDLQDRLRLVRYQRDVVSRLHGHAVDARKSAVQEVFDRVASLANRFYDILHSGESIGSSALNMRRSTARSTELTTRFDGKSEHPLLYYGESHLDTLGLCYCLAFRRQEADDFSEFKILVLDDVLHSVDAAHRTLFVRLLGDEFNDHQLIVTTHDSIFFGQLRQRLGGACTFSRIVGWDFELGPRFAKFGTDLDKLILGDPREMQPEDVAASAGRLLEGTLRIVTENLGISLPVKFERPYTIGDLWPPQCKACKKQKGFLLARPGLTEQVESTYWVRNACGAHPDQSVSPVTNQEMLEFRDAVLAFINATLCPGCNTSITKRANGDWRCECGVLDYERTLATARGESAPPQHDMVSDAGMARGEN
jgi:AAA domain-containing protein